MALMSGSTSTARLVFLGDASSAVRSVRTLEGSMGSLHKASLLLKGALATVAIGGFGYIVKQAADFEKSLNMLQAVSHATNAQMRQMSKLAKQLGADVKIPGASAADAANAMKELAKGGLSVRDSMAAARGTLLLAAAAQTTVEDASKITANALNMFGLKGKEAARVADLLAAAANASTGDISDFALGMQQAGASAHALGIPIQDLTTSLMMMANAGIKGQDAGTSLKTMFMRLGDPSLFPKINSELKALNINLYDATGHFVGMRSMVEQLSTSLAGATQQQKFHAAAVLGGSDAMRGILNVLEQGTAAWDKNAKAVEKHGEAARLGAAAMKGYKGSLEALKNVVETLAVVFGEKLLPPLTDVVNQFGKWLNGQLNDPSKVAAWSAALHTMGGYIKEAAELVKTLAEGIDRFVGLLGGYETSIKIIAVAFAAWKVVGLLGWLADLRKAMALLTATETATGLAGIGSGLTGVGGAAAGATPRVKALASMLASLRLMSVIAIPIVVSLGFIAFGNKVAGVDVVGEAKKMGSLFADWFKSGFEGNISGWWKDTKGLLSGFAQKGKALNWLLGNGWNSDMELAGEKMAEAVIAGWAKKMTAGLHVTVVGDTVVATGVASTALAPGGGQAVVPKGVSVVNPIPKGVSTSRQGGPGIGTHNQTDWQSGNAYDWMTKAGTPVLSPVSGYVTKVSGHDASQGLVTTSTGKKIFGYGISITGAGGSQWYLAHLDDVTFPLGEQRTPVAEGQVIGYVADGTKVGIPSHVHVARPWGTNPALVSAPQVPLAAGSRSGASTTGKGGSLERTAAQVKPTGPKGKSGQATYTIDQLVQLATAAGFDDPAMAAAVMMAESGGDPGAVNSYIENGKRHYVRGLFQISDVHGANSTFDVSKNIAYAKKLQASEGWDKPWAVVSGKGGAYTQYIAAARAAAGQVKPTGGAGDVGHGAGGFETYRANVEFNPRKQHVEFVKGKGYHAVDDKAKQTSMTDVTGPSAQADVAMARAGETKGTKDDLAALRTYVSELTKKIRSGSWKGHDLADLIKARTEVQGEIDDIVSGKSKALPRREYNTAADPQWDRANYDKTLGDYVRKVAAAAKKAAAAAKAQIAEVAKLEGPAAAAEGDLKKYIGMGVFDEDTATELTGKIAKFDALLAKGVKGKLGKDALAQFKTLFGDLTGAAKDGGAKVVAALKDQWQAIADAKDSLGGTIQKGLDFLNPKVLGLDSIAGALPQIHEAMQKLASGFLPEDVRAKLKAQLGTLTTTVDGGLSALIDKVTDAKGKVADAWGAFGDHVADVFDAKVLTPMRAAFSNLDAAFDEKRFQRTVAKATKAMEDAVGVDPTLKALVDKRVDLWREYYAAVAAENVEGAGLVQDAIIQNEDDIAATIAGLSAEAGEGIARSARDIANDYAASADVVVGGVQKSGAAVEAAVAKRWNDLADAEVTAVRGEIAAVQAEYDAGSINLPQALDRVKAVLLQHGMSEADASQLLSDPIALALKDAVAAFTTAIGLLTTAINDLKAFLAGEGPSIAAASSVAASGLAAPWQEQATLLADAVAQMGLTLQEAKGFGVYDETGQQGVGGKIAGLLPATFSGGATGGSIGKSPQEIASTLWNSAKASYPKGASMPEIRWGEPLDPSVGYMATLSSGGKSWIELSPQALTDLMGGSSEALGGLIHEFAHTFQSPDTYKLGTAAVEGLADAFTGAIGPGAIAASGLASGDISVGGGYTDWTQEALNTYGIDMALDTQFETMTENERRRMQIPGMARGGMVTKPTLALVGEKGPEMVVPMSGVGGIDPLPRGLGGGAAPITVENHFPAGLGWLEDEVTTIVRRGDNVEHITRAVGRKAERRVLEGRY